MRKRAGWVGAVWLLMAGCGDDVEDGASGGGGAGTGSGAQTTATSSAATGTASSGAGAGEGTSSGAGQGGDGGSGEGGAGSFELEITWETCPLYSSGQPGPTVECATIRVPSRWDDLGSEPIDFFVKRVPAAVQPARAQVWYLEGGPGAAGDSFDGLAALVGNTVDDVDQYLPDHRGTGRSSRLGCNAEDPGTLWGTQIAPDEWSTCLDDVKATWGELVKAFTITNAARDLGEVIEATRAPDQQVIVFGGSYGTTWANRYLALYPDQPTAVGMSALAVDIPLDPADRWFNELGERFMSDFCAADETCAAHLGPDPWATMTETFDAMDDGWCSEVTSLGLDRYLFQELFAGFFYQWWERALIPAMTYRLSRCNDDDIAAFEYLNGLFGDPQVVPSFSLVLNGLIGTSEMWSVPPPSAASFDDFRDGANVAQGLVGQYAAHFDEWPRYELDEHAGTFGTPTEHMLLLGGELDFIAAESREPALANYESPTRPFILLQNAGHGIGASPYQNGRACAIDLLLEFIADPAAEIDASCAAQVWPVDFEPPPGATSDLYLGTNDIWGDDALLPGAAPRPPLPEMTRALAPIREALRGRSIAR